MAQFHDYGPVQGLTAPDAKLYSCRDERGNMCAVFLDLQAKRYALFAEFRAPQWSAGDLGNVDITDGDLEVHGGVAQLRVVTWKNTAPDGKARFGVLELEKVY